MSEQHKGGQGHDPANDEAHSLGIAGGMARFFIQSPLSPVLFLAMLALGILGLIVTPRQEDPQISVPMVDIFVGYPGASSQQVARLAIEFQVVTVDVTRLGREFGSSNGVAVRCR